MKMGLEKQLTIFDGNVQTTLFDGVYPFFYSIPVDKELKPLAFSSKGAYQLNFLDGIIYGKQQPIFSNL